MYVRFVKYTPQHDFCVAVFYGSFAPQNAGVICTQTVREDIVQFFLLYSLFFSKAKFRIAATGYIMELNHSFEIMKKLKLIGEPFKIYKNTAFVKGMFNTTVKIFQSLHLKIFSLKFLNSKVLL